MEFTLSLIVYFVSTFAIIRFKKHIPVSSILFLFMAFCFISFVVTGIYFQFYPEYSFLNSSHFQIDFFKDVVPHYPRAFTAFLIGYLSFIAGYLVVGNRTVKIDLANRLGLPFYLIVAFFLITNWFSFFFRLNFHVAVAKDLTPAPKFANYLWYSFHYLSLIFLVFVVYKAMKSTSKSKFWVSLFCGLNFGIASFILGWKSGIIWVIVIFIHVFFYLKHYRPNLNVLFLHRKNIIISMILLIIVTSMGIKVLPVYRKKVLEQHRSLDHVKSELLKPVSFNDAHRSTITILNRLTGINTLVPIVAFVNDDFENPVSLWSNIFERGSYHPEVYYGQMVIKDPGVAEANGYSTHAPSGIGVFYIYGNLIGVAIGFGLIGFCSALFENTMIRIIRHDESFIAFYTIVYTIIFPAVVFEGTVFFFLKRHFGSFLVVFICCRVFLYLYEKMQKNRIPINPP